MDDPVRTPTEPAGRTGFARVRQFLAASGRTRKVLIGLACLLAPLSLTAVLLLHLHGLGKLPMTWQRRPLTAIEHRQGKAYECGLHCEWMSAHEGPSPAVVLEDGVPLGPGNAIHQTICDSGNGRFSFWYGEVLFSASDNSDPRTNRRRYEVYWPTPVRTRVRWAVSAAAVALNALAIFLAVTVFIPWFGGRLARPAGRLRALGGRLVGHPSFAAAGAVFAAALVVQLVNFGLHFRDPEMARTGYSIRGVPFTDALEWYDQGASLACGQGMTSRWPAIRPGYGLFLALFFTWTGPSYMLAVVLNLLLTSLAAALLCRAGERLASRWVGVAAGLGFATHQLALSYPLTLGTESLGLFCSVLTLHQLLRGIETGDRRSFLGAGVFLGLSNLARPLTLPAFPLYVIAVVSCLWGCRPRRAVLARAAVFGGGLLLVLAPWLLRQWLAFGILSISHNTADALYAASSPQYGQWTGAIYREPGVPTAGIKERYDYFQKKTAANLRDDPGYYLHNVGRSYVACFEHLSASARQDLPLFGVVVILGHYFAWGLRRRRTARQAGLCALAIGAVAVTFLAAALGLGASFDLVMLVLLPLVTRPRAALIHITGCLGAVLGVALFGMGNPDPRLLFCLEWGFLLTSLASLGGGCAWLCDTLATFAGAPPVPRPSIVADAGPLPRWFTLARGAAVAFLVIGALRVAVLTAATTVPPSAPRRFTAREANDIVRAFDRQAPGLLRGTDLEPGQVLTTLELFEASAPPLACHDKLLVLPLRLVNEPYYLPASTSLPHWSRYFAHSDHDRTVCYFQEDGVPTPKVPYYRYPVSFPGFVPRRLYGKDVVLICRVNYDAKYEAAAEAVLFEGIALIPTGERRELRLDEAYLATHPQPPATYGPSRAGSGAE